MVVVAKSGGAGRSQRDAPLVGLYFSGNSDDHIQSNPLVCALVENKTRVSVPSELDSVSAGR